MKIILAGTDATKFVAETGWLLIGKKKMGQLIGLRDRQAARRILDVLRDH